MSKWLIRITLSLLALLLVIIPALLAFLLASETGSRWAISEAAKRAPGTLTIDRIEGTLLNGVRLSNIDYQHLAVDFHGEQLALAINPVALLQGSLSVVTLDGEKLRLEISDTEQASEPADAESGAGIAGLPDISLPFQISAPHAQLRELLIIYADQAWAIERITLAGHARGSQLSLQHLEVVSDDYRIALGADLVMQMPWQIDGWLDWQMPLPENLATLLAASRAEGEARLRGDLSALNVHHRLQQPARLESEGELALLEPQPVVDLLHQWQTLTLHLPDGRPLILDNGRLQTRGNIDHYHLLLDHLELRLDELPTLAVDLRADGNRESLDIASAGIASEHGSLALSGQLGWIPHLAWQLELQAEQLDPAFISPQLSGRLSGQARSEGQLADPDAPEINVLLTRLVGELNQQPLDASGRLDARGTDDIRGELSLTLGSTHLEIDGQWSEKPDLHASINAPELGYLLDQLGGSITLNAHLHGSRDNPLLDANAEARNLTFAEYQLANLDLEVASSLRPTTGMTLALELGPLSRAGQLLLSSAQLQGTGRLDDHRLQWQLDQRGEQLQGQLDGSFSEGQWLAQLLALEIQGPLSGTWQLDQAVSVSVAADAAHLMPLCLEETTRHASLCAELLWHQEGELLADLQLSGVPLAPMAMLLPTPARIEGELNASAQLRRQQGIMTGSLQVDAGSGNAVLDDNGDGDYRIPWQIMRAEAHLAEQQLRISSEIQLDQDSRADALLTVDLDGDQSRLDGQIGAAIDDLAWLELLIPRMRNPQGQIRGDLAISGTLAEPGFSGNIDLSGGAADIPELGLELSNIHLRAHGDAGGQLVIEGGLRSGPGELRVDGELDTSEALPWPVVLNISGREVLAVQRPDARILLNPDLQLALDGTRLTVRGEVRIPEARLSPRQLPQQAVSLSRDVRLVGVEEQQQTSPWQTDTDVQVLLGDQVRIDGFGLTGRFAGAVRIQDQPQRPIRLTGEIRIEDGRYRAYGQNLRVERGRLLFEGPPDNPGLDIVAVRVIAAHNIRAGLEIGGTLRDPRSRIFSEPAMEESEAMAWLLTGRPLSGASEEEGSAILQAITLYGIEQGDFITESVGDALGLEVGIDTEGEFEDTALMLGRQLSSRLYLRYSVGLFESLSSVMLRYTLSRTLSLETRSSSEAQSVDLIYRRER